MPKGTAQRPYRNLNPMHKGSGKIFERKEIKTS